MGTTVAVFALVLAYIALVAAYLALRTLAKLRRAATILGAGGNGRETMVEAAERHIKLTAAVANKLDGLRQEIHTTRNESVDGVQAGQALLVDQLGRLDEDAARSLRNVALIRYDAFAEVAGRMSFSLALLDDLGDGVTLTAIAGRTDTRLYAKGVAAGAGQQELSPEELQAVGAAMRGRTPRSVRTATPTTGRQVEEPAAGDETEAVTPEAQSRGGLMRRKRAS